jgi:hypothetical protein
MRRFSMLLAAVAAPLMLVLVISAGSATVPARKLHHVVRPIAAVAMDGARVAYVTDDDAVRVWNVRTGTIAGLQPGSGHYMDHPFIPEVAIAGTRVAWITLGITGNSQETWARLYTRSLTSGTRRVASAFRTDGYSDGDVELWDGNWLTGLVGSGKLLAVSRWTTKPNADFSGNVISNARLSVIPATREPLRVIASGEQSIVSASSDANRVAVLGPDDSVGIYSATGALLKQIRPSSAKEIAYGGGRLVVLTDAKTLEVYDSRSGELLHTWPIHTKHSYLQAEKLSAYGRIGLYVVSPISGTQRIHLVDLDNGKELVLPPASHMSGSQYAVVRQLGVVYSVNTYRSGTPPKMAATLVFLSTARVLSILAAAPKTTQTASRVICRYPIVKHYRPSFFVDPGLYRLSDQPGETQIGLCAQEAATAKVVLFAPVGVEMNLNATPGAVLGRLSAKSDRLGKRIGIDFPRRNGSIVAADPKLYAHNRCSPGVHHAVWLLRTRSVDGKFAINLPLYVDEVDPTAGFANYRMQMCFSSPSDRTRISGWPGHTIFRSMNLFFDPNVVAEQPTIPAAYVWHGVFTPFRSNGLANAAGRVEGRATQLLPVVWTLSGSYDPVRQAANITGSLIRGGQPVRSDPYGFSGLIWQGTALGGDFPGILNPSRLPLDIDASGHFSASAPITKGAYFRASGGTVLQYGIGCKPPSITPKGCVSASLSGFAMPSPIIRVTVP